jgi:HSP20 family protein
MMSSQTALAQMNRLRNEIDRVFSVDSQAWSRSSAYPPVNIWEDDDAYYVEAEIPGLSMEDLEIFVHEGDQLSIKGMRRASQVDGRWHRRERAQGEFQRSFKLSDAVDVEKVEAELKQGVLTVTLPKSEAVKPRRIEVKTS